MATLRVFFFFNSFLAFAFRSVWLNICVLEYSDRLIYYFSQTQKFLPHFTCKAMTYLHNFEVGGGRFNCFFIIWYQTPLACCNWKHTKKQHTVVFVTKCFNIYIRKGWKFSVKGYMNNNFRHGCVSFISIWPLSVFHISDTL